MWNSELTLWMRANFSCTPNILHRSKLKSPEIIREKTTPEKKNSSKKFFFKKISLKCKIREKQRMLKGVERTWPGVIGRADDHNFPSTLQENKKKMRKAKFSRQNDAHWSVTVSLERKTRSDWNEVFQRVKWRKNDKQTKNTERWIWFESSGACQ